MKLCRFNDDRVGVVSDGQIRDVTDVVADMLAGRPAAKGDPLVALLPHLIEAPLDHAKLAEYAVSDVRLASPVAAPSRILAAPVNYKAHVEEMIASGLAQGHQLDIAKAGLFLKAVSSLAAPSDGIEIRFPERRTDHEIELVIVIGRGGRDIPLDDALGAVAGYTLGLDITLRGTEDRSLRKSIDGYTVIGPWLVTADEIDDTGALDIALSVNGTTRQKANTAELVWDVARIVSFASTYVTLLPGDLIFTGTPQGVGPIRPGDVLRAEGQWIGVMEVQVRP